MTRTVVVSLAEKATSERLGPGNGFQHVVFEAAVHHSGINLGFRLSFRDWD